MTGWSEALNPVLAVALLITGMLCMITQKRVMKQVVGLAVMLQGALISIIDAGHVNGDMRTAQSMVISALVVEAIVLAIALALIVNVFRYHPEGRVADLDTLKG